MLGAALLLVLLLDPWAVLAAGFWLSFGAVAFRIVSADDAAFLVGAFKGGDRKSVV